MSRPDFDIVPFTFRETDNEQEFLGEAPAPYAPKPKPRVGALPTVNYCAPSTWGDVFSHWRTAVDAVARANDRLRLLKIVTRVIAWRSGPEQVWFGNYTSEHFEQLTRNMQQIADILNDPKLTITCDPNMKAYGKSFPGIRQIKLGAAWLNERRPHERTQTLVHEAAHIAGVVNLPEGRKGQPACAKKLAQQNCFKAMRNADNYGYYALNYIGEYQNASPANCVDDKGKPINFSPVKTCR